MLRVCLRIVCVAVVAGLAFPRALPAAVKTEEKTRVEFGGFMGKMVNMFGGRAAKEGIISRVAVAGDRKLTANDTTGQIIDLAEEKIYDLDMKNKTYEVTSFAELKKKFEQARAEAAKSAGQAQPQKPSEQKQGEPQKELEVDFDLKETGQQKKISGFDCRQVVMTITVREKDRTLAQSGGLVLTSDMWLTPRVAALKEVEDFDRRYALKMADLSGMQASMEQMAAMAAMYPGIQKAMSRMEAEKVNMDGTPVLTAFTIEAVRGAAQMAEAQQQKGEDEAPGGIGGFLAKKMMKKGGGDDAGPRSKLMTSTSELMKVSTQAAAADVALPAGFKQK